MNRPLDPPDRRITTLTGHRFPGDTYIETTRPDAAAIAEALAP